VDTGNNSQDITLLRGIVKEVISSEDIKEHRECIRKLTEARERLDSLADDIHALKEELRLIIGK